MVNAQFWVILAQFPRVMESVAFKIFGVEVFKETVLVKARVIALKRPHHDFKGFRVDFSVICKVFGYSLVVLSAEHDKA